MLPPVHLAVGYLCYAALVRVRRDGPPADGATLAVIAGAALPDVVDKPLWLAGVVDVGRTIGHSLLFVVPLAAIAWLLARRRERPEVGVAFVVGLSSHVATDVPWHLVSGEYRELGFLLWPITPMPPYTGTTTVGTVAGVAVTTLWLEAGIAIAAIALWWRDGRPGLVALRGVRSA